MTQVKQQGTYKAVTEIFAVKNILFRTNGKGKVYPLVQLFKNKLLKKRNTDAIMFDNVGTLYANNIGIGSRLKICFDENNVPEVKGIVEEADKMVEVPTHCNSCNKLYEQHENKEIYCHNAFCPATARGFLYKLIKIAVPAVKTEMIAAFLNNYPVGGVSGSLDSFSEFQYIYTSIKDKHTAGREQKWIKIHPELGEQLYELECSFDTFLHSDSMMSHWFWHVCNFPQIDDETLYELTQMNPRELINGENKKQYLALSVKAREFVDHNLDFVDWLVRFFDKFGEKHWEV